MSAASDREAMAKAFRVFLLGVEDVLGKPGLATTLRRANLTQYLENYPPPTTERAGHKARYITQIARVIYNLYGARGSRAIMQRVGRAQAKSGMAENQTLVNVTKAAMKFVPIQRRIHLAIEMAARAVNEQIGDDVHLIEEGNTLYYDSHECCYCIDWSGESTAVCYAAAGFLHGLLAALIPDTEFRVDEMLCRAKGDALCRYRISIVEPNG